MKNKERNLGTPRKTYYTSSFMSNLGKARVIMTILGMLFGLLMGAGLAVLSIIPGMLIMWGIGKRFEGMILLEMYHSCFVAHFHEPVVIEYHSIKKIVISRYVITFFLQKKGKEEKTQIGLTSFSKQGRQEVLQFFDHRKGKAGLSSSTVIEDKRLSPKALIFVWSLFWIFLFSIGLANWGYQNRVEIAKFWKVQNLLWKGGCPKCDLQNIDLSRQDLSSFNAAGANLRKAILSRSFLNRANLSKANLSEANLSEADLSDVDFSEANLFDANLYATELQNTNFYKANLAMASLGNNDFRKTNLKGAILEGAHFGLSTLDGMQLSQMDFSKCRFGSTEFRKANLSKTIFEGAMIYTTEFMGASGEYSVFISSKIESSDFSNANFSNAKIEYSIFKNTILVKSNFTGVEFGEKNDFTGADLSGATWVNGEKCLPKSIGRCILASENEASKIPN